MSFVQALITLTPDTNSCQQMAAVVLDPTPPRAKLGLVPGELIVTLADQFPPKSFCEVCNELLVVQPAITSPAASIARMGEVTFPPERDVGFPQFPANVL